MTKQYESEFYSFICNTEYPFKSLIGLRFDVILDITLYGDLDIYLSSIRYKDLEFSHQGSPIYKVIGITDTGIYPVMDLDGLNKFGYIKIGPGIQYYNLVVKSFLPEEAMLLNSRIFPYEPITEFPENITEGYNMDISITTDKTKGFEVNTVFFLPGLNNGIGKYCGEPIAVDGIYSINGVRPDSDGNLQWERDHFFAITTGTNSIEYDLLISEDRLLCTRTGFKGPKGWDGPSGPNGDDGEDPNAIEIIYDYCDSPHRGKV